MELGSDSARKKGIAGILSAIILFSLVFTVGVGFYFAAGNAQQLARSSFDNRLSLQDQQSLENLSLVAGVSGGTLSLSITNTGGVPSTIVSVYVTSLAAENVSDFLVGEPSLSTTLPLTLDVGASTAGVIGSITISQTAFDLASYEAATGQTTVFVNVLTSRGDIFSVSYPAVNAVTLKNVVVNKGIVYKIVQDQLDSNIDAEQIGGCQGCVGEVNVGGNILVMLLTASPSPVTQGEQIVVQAEVMDVSSSSATQVEVLLGAVYSGSATVSPDISQSSQECPVSGSPQSVLSEGSAVFTCSFVAEVGSSGGGTVTFFGEATACIQTSSITTSTTATTTSTTTTSSGFFPTPTCTTGTAVVSSVTSSNVIQVGQVISYGAWQPNFDYYYETSCTSTTSCTSSPCLSTSSECSMAVISNDEYYVAVYIEVTNSYSTPLTVLDGSYIQSVSPGIDFDLFVTQSPATYTSSPPTLTSYQCVQATGAAPEDLESGQTCLTVEPGQTVTLMFAAAGQGSTTWEWGKEYPGGTTYVGGDNAQIILEFAKDSNGVWASATQDIPFEGLYVT